MDEGWDRLLFCTSSVTARSLAIVIAIASATLGIVASQSPDRASALTGSEFDPGNIISDSAFYESNAMSESEIQSFLNGKIGTCANGACLNVLTNSVASRSRLVSDSTGNVRCEAFQGGQLTAAAIIYRVQVACGISAKVILVTLQKEQGLVTKTAPSQAALDRAMGYACPDTAPCAPTTLGFGNQIYAGTLQLKTYKASHFGMQPGSRSVLWNPNGACGNSVVNVQNYATAALYNYTPYRPNAAALATLYGTGDGCSSYGNRNFWVYYSSWFGPTYEAAPGAIAVLWNSVGGNEGAMGPAQAGLESFPGGGGGTGQRFQNGSIMASTSGLTVAIMNGPIRDSYFRSGGPAGPLGWPVDPGTSFPGAGGGTGQRFQNGSLMASTVTGGTVAIMDGSIRDNYFANGGPSGSLGWPVAGLQVFSGSGSGTGQQFQNGSSMSSPAVGTFPLMNGSIRDQYFSLGGPNSALGWPIAEQECAVELACTQKFQGRTLEADPIDTLHRFMGGNAGELGAPVGGTQHFAGSGGGTGQRYVGGSIMSSPVAGTFALMNGSIRDQYFNAGGPSSVWGWPTAKWVCAGSICTQTFQGGTIRTNPIDELHDLLGGDSGVMGPAMSGVETFTGSGGGTGQRFLNGSIMSSAEVSKALMNGPIRDAYFAGGGPSGPLGWPVDPVQSFADGAGQRFQNGSLMASTATGTTSALLNGPIRDTYFNSGGPAGVLGWPMSGVETFPGSGGGTGQRFQNGSMMASPSAGTFTLLNGPIRNQYFNAGGPSTAFGWPMANQVCTGSDCSQTFQGGVLKADPTGALQRSLGGDAGIMGSAQSGLEYFMGSGSGVGQRFLNGSIMSSPTAGTFALMNGSIRDQYFAAGGPSGTWGWPTTAQTCTASLCAQTFQGGSIKSK